MLDSVMEKKKIDEHETGPSSPRPVDRFGFIRADYTNASDALKRSKSTSEHER